MRLRPSLPYVGSLLSLVALVACSDAASSPGDASPSDPSADAATPEGDASPPSTPTDAGPVTCASPAPPAPTTLARPAGSPTMAVTLPVRVTGTTTEAIDFQYFTFTLTEVVKLHVKAQVADFEDVTEKTGIGIEVRNTMLGEDPNKAHARASLDPTKPAADGSSDWLYPGTYQVVLSRATYASANTTVPTLPHAYTLSIDVELPPTLTASCTLPASAKSQVNVKARAECNAWCKKLPACGVACHDDCEIPVGQCEASVLAKLTCLSKASFECVKQGAGSGYSIDADCKADASVCAPGDIRKK